MFWAIPFIECVEKSNQIFEYLTRIFIGQSPSSTFPKDFASLRQEVVRKARRRAIDRYFGRRYRALDYREYPQWCWS